MSHHVPRFSNPYNLPETTHIVSRNDLQEDKEDAPVDFADDAQQLHDHLASIFEIPSPLPTTSIAPVPPSEPAQIVFRIWSTSEVQPIKLSNAITWKGIPKPPPPAEDTKPERKIRRRRAQASAVDGTQILTEAASQLKQMSKPLDVRTISGDKLPVCIVVSRLQQHRTTRPPVPASELRHHPYTRNGPLNPSASTSAKCVPVIEDVTPAGPWRVKRTRHRRQKRQNTSASQKNR